MKHAFVTIAVVVIAALAVWVLLPGGEAGANVVVVYSPHGEDLLNDFKARFERAYPDNGIEVRVVALPGQVCKARIRSEKERPHADVWWGGAITDFMQLEREDLLAPYRPDWIEQIDPLFHSPTDAFAAQWLTPEVIMYNSDALTPEQAPGDWDEIVDERWRGQVVIRDPLKSSTMKTIFSAMIYRFYRDDKTPDRGYDWLRKLDRNTVTYSPTPTDMHQRLAARQGLVTLWNMPDAFLYREKHKLPIAFKIPKSGTPVLADCIAIVKGAPHPESARLFYDFVTKAESLVAQAQSPYNRIPARKDVPQDKLPAWMTSVSIPKMEIDWDLFAREQETWMQFWDENIRGKGGSP